MAIPGYEARFGRERPVIAVVGFNAATEVTDYVIPYGVLAESGVADVWALGISDGPIQMKPALRFNPQALSTSRHSYPDGADYVVVPNSMKEKTTRASRVAAIAGARAPPSSLSVMAFQPG